MQAYTTAGRHHLERLRAAELDLVTPWLFPNATVLELGGGNGYQAHRLASMGVIVTSLDIARTDGPHADRVALYDGRHIPLETASVDVVFTSNVLEHVHDLPALSTEIRRVLKPSGRAVHLLPSSSWRLWTSLAFAPWLIRRLTGHRAFFEREGSVDTHIREHGRVGAVARALTVPIRAHGEFPNAVAELYHFSASAWRRRLTAAGFTVVTASTNQLFYTGFGVAPGLSIGARRRLARVLGASCHLFVLRHD